MKSIQIIALFAILSALQLTQGIKIKSKCSGTYPYGVDSFQTSSWQGYRPACFMFLESQKFLSARSGILRSSLNCNQAEDVWVIENHPYESGYYLIKNYGNNKYIDIGIGGIYLTDNLATKVGTRFKFYQNGSSRANSAVSKKVRWLAINSGDGSVTRTTNNSTWEAFILLYVSV